MPSTPVVAPDERDLEGRRVHRVREYWLEYEAMKNLHTLQDFKIPAALFEDRMTEVNKHNSRFVQSSIGESAQNFFREQTDDTGVLCLVIKLSEKLMFRKPSRNILKRWNLSNGMLYLFYSVIGRSHPPTAKEVLEPFYYQKRIDFVRVVCMLPTANAKGGGTRKRQREAQRILSPTDLEMKAAMDVQSFFQALQKHYGPDVQEEAAGEAVERGVWLRQGAIGGGEGTVGVWRLNLDKVYDWSFDNGALQAFSEACRCKWLVVKPAWEQWNTELGNNAVAWEELWKNAEVETPEDHSSHGGMASTAQSANDSDEMDEDDDEEEVKMVVPRRSRRQRANRGRNFFRGNRTPHLDSSDDEEDEDDEDSVSDGGPLVDAETGEPVTEAALNLLRLATHVCTP